MRILKVTMIICWAVILQAACKPDGGGVGQKSPVPAVTDNRRELFGVLLRPQATALLNDVENRYGKRVKEERKDGGEYSEFGFSTVDADGTPVVSLNPNLNRERFEAVLVHELQHLRYGADPWITFEFGFPPQSGSEEDKKLAISVVKDLRGPMQHYAFYPAIREMGLDPSQAFEAQIKQQLESRVYDQVRGKKLSESDYFRIFLDFYKASLEFNDPKLLSDLEQTYERMGWGRQLRMAQRLVGIVKQAKLHTPDQDIPMLMECVNLYLHGKFRVQITADENRRLGAINQRNIRLGFLRPNEVLVTDQ